MRSFKRFNFVPFIKIDAGCNVGRSLNLDLALLSMKKYSCLVCLLLRGSDCHQEIYEN